MQQISTLCLENYLKRSEQGQMDVIQENLINNGIMLLFGDVDSLMSERAVEFVMAHNFGGSKLKNLTFVINSSGGSLPDGFAIIDTMINSSIPVHTVGLGEISSAALMIFMAGAPGNRSLTPNTSIMSHQWSGELRGKMHELVSAQTDMLLTTERVKNHYLKYSKLDSDEITRILLPQHDVFLTAQQAVEYGLADRIQK